MTLPTDSPSIPIRYNATTQTLSFIGIMTTAEQTALKSSNPTVAAIDELFRLPRLAVKFYEPIFTASLKTLPPTLDFKAQLPAALADKISYDTEQRLLRFAGIMTQAEQAALDTLLPNIQPLEVAYHDAVHSLATQPITIPSSDDRIWLTDNDLDTSLPANNTWAKRLANAAAKALSYLSKTLATRTVVQQSSAQLGLTEAVTRYLLTQYTLLPDSLLKHLTDVFAATTGVVDYATRKTTLDGWYWANRVAAMWKKWKLILADLEKITPLTTGAQLLDFETLPLDSNGAIASLDNLLRTSCLLQLRGSLPETEITLLEVLEKLNAGTYVTAADFAADVHRLSEEWLATDVEALIASLNLTYPADYLLVETWERLRQAFSFLDSLNAKASIVRRFSAAAMTFAEAGTLKELLRSKFGSETWLTLSTEIQDVLRERKRDALAA